MMKTYWFAIPDVYSDYYGEEFFVEAENYKDAWEIARNVFKNEPLTCHGAVSEEFAEVMGYDTY